MNDRSTDQVLRWRQVRDLVGLSRSTLWRMSRDGRFPQPVQLSSPASVGWLWTEVDAWLRERAAQRPKKTTAAKVTAETEAQ
jgi:prophage regulatory protein